MPSRHAPTVPPTPEPARLVAADVASEAYGGAGEVVRAGLRSPFAGDLEVPDAPARGVPRRVGPRATRAAQAGPNRG